ncbi:MAG: threonine-phosphate decarboxylase CobD [Kyrpidia sp.]|nr:threonine-phosphate decarboxylase CobD [Kyrpidia sp.]
MDVTETFMVHGGNVWAYREQWGGDLSGMADFSANINPLGPPDAVRAAMRAALEEVHRYPDPRQERFRRRVAETWGVPSDAVIAGNGAVELIFLLMAVWRPRKILALAPSFTEYEEAARVMGARVRHLALRPENAFVPDGQTVADAIRAGDVDMVALANPNNPTGVLWRSEELDEVLTEAHRSGVRVLLDEAFLDFSPDEHRLSRIGQAAKSEGLFVLRSMTKFYSIPGLRLGYGAAAPELVRCMDRLRPPWSVNGPSLAAGIAALGETAFARTTRTWVAEQRNRMAEEFRRLGFDRTPSRANFLLAWREDFDIRRAWPHLAARGVFVRDCRSFVGLDERFLRVAVRPEQDQKRLFAGLRALCTG